MVIYTNLETGNVHSCTLISSVPEGITWYEVQPPEDKQYRGAWEIIGSALDYNMVKAKELAHEKRRIKRVEDFKPFDDIITLSIPGQDAIAAENARTTIRIADAALQTVIDAVTNIDELKAIQF